MEFYFKRHDSQKTLFASRIDRLEMYQLALPKDINQEFVVNLWRNHNFESLLPFLDLYAQFGRINLKWNVGSYDDSFSFNNLQNADADLIWMDSSRLNNKISFDEWLIWLEDRLKALRIKSTAPIILLTWNLEDKKSRKIQTLCDSMAAVYFGDINVCCMDRGIKLLDERLAATIGTIVSRQAQLLISRELACKWLPAVLLPPIKAIAIDLDNTLHKGVLGEDGIDGVELTLGHEKLQKSLKKYQENGVFLALISKNEKKDVLELFKRRLDFPLRIGDFSSIQVSWGEKGEALKKVAKDLRISAESIIFVDDNPGELINVLSHLPNAKTVFAEEDGDLTARVIEYFPGLWRWKITDEDFKRINDLKANKDRENLAQGLASKDEYLKSLEVKLNFDLNSKIDIERITALSSKTNQFNLSIQRFTQVELIEKMQTENSCVVSVRLSDRFSDSGIIATIVANKQAKTLVIEEVCMSCRAMGRGLENYIILNAVNFIMKKHKCSLVEFMFKHGERNTPALDWIKELSGSIDLPSNGIIRIDESKIYVKNDGLVEINKNWT